MRLVWPCTHTLSCVSQPYNTNARLPSAIVRRCIRVYSTSTGEMLQCVDTGAQVCSLNWSINTNEIASTHGYTSYSIAIWKYPSMLKLANLTGHQQRCVHVACVRACGRWPQPGQGKLEKTSIILQSPNIFVLSSLDYFRPQSYLQRAVARRPDYRHGSRR